MSESSHRTDIIILSVLGGLLAAVMLVLVILTAAPGKGERIWGVRTTHSANVSGMLVYHALLERLGFSPRRLERSVLHQEPEGGVLFVIDPVVRINGAEVDSLRRWISDGGVLVCTAGGPLDPIHDFGLSVEDSYSRPEPEQPPDAEKHPPTKALSGPALSRDVESVQLQSVRTLQPPAEVGGENLSDAQRLFADGTGLRIAGRRLGTGYAIVLSDSSFLANGTIDREDNVMLAANLAGYARHRARGDGLTFDEYHFGYGPRESGWSVLLGMLFTTAPGWSVLCLTAAGILYLLYRGRKFGTRRAPGRGRRRSRMEFVESVGATYRAAGANRLSLRLIYRAFRRRAAQAVGLPDSAGAQEIAARMARHAGGDAATYGELFRRCESVLRKSSVSKRTFQKLLQRMSEVEAEVMNER